MQTELSSRIEKIWSMAEIALKQGYVDYGTDGHSKIVRLSGLAFKFIDNTLVRVRGQRLDVMIVHHKTDNNVVFFPGAQTVIQFMIGDDEVLDRSYSELASMQKTFSPKKAA